MKVTALVLPLVLAITASAMPQEDGQGDVPFIPPKGGPPKYQPPAPGSDGAQEEDDDQDAPAADEGGDDLLTELENLLKRDEQPIDPVVTIKGGPVKFGFDPDGSEAPADEVHTEDVAKRDEEEEDDDAEEEDDEEPEEDDEEETEVTEEIEDEDDE